MPKEIIISEEQFNNTYKIEEEQQCEKDEYTIGSEQGSFPYYHINEDILTEDRESKGQSKIKQYLLTRFKDENKVNQVFNGLRTDIPNIRLPYYKENKGEYRFGIGVARMFCDGQLSNQQTIAEINRTLKYVASDAHINEYDNNLNNLSASQLISKFSSIITTDVENEKQTLANQEYTQSDYNIVQIPDFETASQYSDYTSWCVTHYEEMYDNYTHGCINPFYFCLKQGFENLEEIQGENCPLDEYGLSMIAVSINEDGSPNTITCRWNHDNGGNDNIMSAEELSHIIGKSFYDAFPPYSQEEKDRRVKALIYDLYECEFEDVDDDDLEYITQVSYDEWLEESIRDGEIYYNDEESSYYDIYSDYELDNDYLEDKYKEYCKNNAEYIIWNFDFANARFDKFECFAHKVFLIIDDPNGGPFIYDEYYDKIIYDRDTHIFCFYKNNTAFASNYSLEPITPICDNILAVGRDKFALYKNNEGNLYDTKTNTFLFDNFIPCKSIENFRSNLFKVVNEDKTINLYQDLDGKAHLLTDKKFNRLSSYQDLVHKSTFGNVIIIGVINVSKFFSYSRDSRTTVYLYQNNELKQLSDEDVYLSPEGTSNTAHGYFVTLRSKNGDFFYVDYNGNLYFQKYSSITSRYNGSENLQKIDYITREITLQESIIKNIYISESQRKRLFENEIIQEGNDRRQQSRKRTKNIIRDYFHNIPQLDEPNEHTQGMTLVDYLERQVVESWFHDRNRYDAKGTFVLLEPLVARIALENGWQQERDNTENLLRLTEIIDYIYTLYCKNEIDIRSISLDSTLEELNQQFGKIIDDEYVKKLQDRANTDYGELNQNYDIFEVKTFEQAKEIGDYSVSSGELCYTQTRSTWDSFTNKGYNKVYCCLTKDWEDVPQKHTESLLPQYPDANAYDRYGLSMIFVFISPEGKLYRSNTRWNHHAEYGEGRDIDTAFTPEDLSKLMGVAFEKLFAPWTDEEANEKGIVKLQDVQTKIDKGIPLENIFHYIDSQEMDGFRIVEINDSYNFINRNNRLLTPDLWYDYVWDFVNGYATVKIDNKLNLLKKDGSLVSQNKWFDGVRNENKCGFFVVYDNGLYNFIDTNGNILSKTWFNNAKAFEKATEYFPYTVARVEREDYYMNLLLINGEFMFPVWISNYSYNDENDTFKLAKDNLYNIFTQEYGLLSNEIWFDSVHRYKQDNYVHVSKDGLSTLMHLDGSFMFGRNKWFDRITRFFEGYAIFNLNDKENYINEKGQVLFPTTSFDVCRKFKNGIAEVVDSDYNSNVATTSGNLIFKDTFDSLYINFEHNKITIKTLDGDIKEFNWNNGILTDNEGNIIYSEQNQQTLSESHTKTLMITNNQRNRLFK